MKKAAARDKANPHIQQIDKKYVRLIDELSKSEQEKAVILDAMTELVLFLDTDLRVIWANKAMREAFNLKPGELNGKHCLPGAAQAEPGLQRLPRGKNPQDRRRPTTLSTSPRTRRTGFCAAIPVRDERGSLSGVVEIVTDITERRRVEEALRQSEQKFRELFENANDMIFLLDFKGKILSCNTAAARTYGYEPEQMHGISLEELLDPEYLTVVRDMFRKKLSDLITNSQEFLTYTRTGEPCGWKSMPGASSRRASPSPSTASRETSPSASGWKKP